MARKGKQAVSKSAYRSRVEAARDGRGNNQAYTSGARNVGFDNNSTEAMNNELDEFIKTIPSD